MPPSRVQHPRMTVSGRPPVTARSGALPLRSVTHPSGRRMARALPKWPASALVLLCVVIALLGIGLVMVLSASIGLRAQAPWRSFAQQLSFAGFGAIALVAGAYADYKVLRRLAVPLLVATGLALAIVLTPLGRTVNGSRRWLDAGPIRIQPSEFAKLALTVVVAALLAARAHRLHEPRLSTRPVALATLAIGVLIVSEPDMGTTMIVVAIVTVMLIASGIPSARLWRMAGALAALVVVFGLLESYRRDRLLTFLHPNRDVSGIGYHLHQSLVGLGSGNFLGVGIGNGRAKLGYLPNASTDFIMSVIGEELGLIGTLLVIGLFVAFGVIGYRIARHAADDFGYLLAAGVTTGVLVQAFFNIGAVCGVLPITGVPLPLISAGGSSLVMLLGSVGILLSIARRGSVADRPSELVSELDESAVGRAVTIGVQHHPSNPFTRPSRSRPARSAVPAPTRRPRSVAAHRRREEVER